ncbi:ABC transporter ATP-binding protein [Botrimarina hoheduenensis]|uniref:Daunorubicin/doxorubicin resistance ATP-binding protein DrrA n=1 Tax=Botrimarina hoheduenensis TaxID=2528000 RepID=A0A5C5VZD3_9BACT|nr:ABC transporter ATP-binding protein [Botrimarina hoheduenensis]TWT43149.1 Daunorubicin/doxorubicin resistance ATP-binding protein DrrA [Botrimarina hoheduenensis]
MPLALAVADLVKAFGERRALDGVSFQAQQGQLVGLLGPNGAGKTTLIRCLIGRCRPDAGSIELFGQPLPARGGRERLGFVPQDLGIYPDLSVRENLHAFGVFHGLRGALLRERIEWALEWTGLKDRVEALPKTFSGGMKRRVNIACGVLHEPAVLLLDEPTVGVDPQSRERIFAMIDTLRQAGTTILLTTHHLEEAETRCERVLIIDHGRVIAEGTVGELIRETVGSDRQATIRLARPLAPEVLKSVALGSNTPALARATLGQALNGSGPNGSVLNGDGNNGYGPTSSTSPQSELTMSRRDSGHDPLTLRTSVRSVALELPRLLEKISNAGGEVRDVEVTAPTLQAVFLHLTGRELRE